MDSLKSTLGAYDDLPGHDAEEDDVDAEALPPGIERDERRMQVRAYNFWASLLDDRNYPHVDDLDPAALPDFGPYGALLDFTDGIEDPAITFLGDKLAEECGANGLLIERLSDVPARSLLTRITDHYMQILASQAPIGFEAEFVNQRGVTILYRGILMPFSSDDETIDYIYGVINWKELADAQATDELLLEIDHALEQSEQPAVRRPTDLPMADWADGPGPAPAVAMGANDDLPGPSFGLDLTAAGMIQANSVEPAGDAGTAAAMQLADWLAAAREMAAAARDSEDRTRAALYDAISRAHDFALAATDAPGEFAELLDQAGLTMQERAPLTPVVKLVFGADYDKTRLTEYATALAHAARLGLARGTLGDYLRQADGGLKGVVARERAHRRSESGAQQPPHKGPRGKLAAKLRALEPGGLDALAPDGSEFSLVMIRRIESGQVVVLGEVPESARLVEQAARQLVG